MERKTGRQNRIRLGYVGLGKMGFNMVERLVERQYTLIVFDANLDVVRRAAGLPAEPAADLASLALALEKPRLIWIMVPAGIVDAVLNDLVIHLDQGDTVIDGGNSHYQDSIRRAGELAGRGINFMDVGVSGGPGGARNGSCLMIGGRKECFEQYIQVFKDLAMEEGYRYMGASGAGHFVKMVHNGIEYGMMQALAEGFAVLKASPLELDLAEVADLYNHGSVITSRMVGWLKNALDVYGQDLEAISGSASQSGEGRWTVDAARELHVPVPIIAGAVDFRDQTANHPSYTGQVISALRNQFGRHDVFKK